MGYYVSIKDGDGEYHRHKVSHEVYIYIRQLEVVVASLDSDPRPALVELEQPLAWAFPQDESNHYLISTDIDRLLEP